VFDLNQRLFCFLLAITSCINFSLFPESSSLSEQYFKCLLFTA